MPEYEHNTGVVIVNRFLNGEINPVHTPAVLVKNHGPFSWGKDAAESVFNAVVMESVAEMGLKTLLLNREAELQQYVLDKHYMRKHGPNAYYGQRAK